MADAAVEFLLENLKQLLVSQASILRNNAGDQVSQMKDELTNLILTLKNSQPGSGYVRRHLDSDVQDVVYRFFNLREAAEIHSFSSSINSYSFPKKVQMYIRGVQLSSSESFIAIAHKIEQIKRNIRDTRNYHDDDRFAAEEDLGSRYSAYGSYKFVGRTNEMKQLLSLLCSDSDRDQITSSTAPRVISISGMGGVGKTTLVQQLYEDSSVRYEYNLFAWVRVSKKVVRGKIFAAILGELERGRGRELSSIESIVEEALISKIFYYLDNYRTLIVLDDIWSLDDWESLKVILPRITTNSGSKLLFTTRMKQVAQTADIKVHLRRLTDDEGCELLLKNVPESLVGIMPEDLTKKIVNFCGGLPLTIVSFPQSMDINNNCEEWKENVNKRLNFAFSKRVETREIQTTLKVLESSYDELPNILQPLFLYMGVLQEDLRVEVEKLYLLSLADDLLTKLQRGERLLNIAQEYVGEKERLLNIFQEYVEEIMQRSMVELDEGEDEREEPTITRFKYCQLNGLMRDLSLLKTKEERFFKFVDFTHGGQPQPVSNSFSSSAGFSSCRAAINLDEYEGRDLPLEDDEMMHMRVLLFSAKKTKVWPATISSLVKFRFLRSLDFEGFNFKLTVLPEGIANAIHLRYLSFKDCTLDKLPSGIVNLKLLCVLDLRVDHSTTLIIPNVLWKLKRLRHLYFPVSFKVQYPGKLIRLDGLTDLETITNFNAQMVNVKDLLNLPKLQYLDAKEVRSLEDIEHIIRRMTKISDDSDADSLRTSLEIRNFDCYTEERHSTFRNLVACQSLTVLCIEGHICRLPMYHKFSGNLTKIIFIGSELVEDPMRTLEQLPKLRVLVLDDAFVGKEIVCSAKGFLELKVLKILNWPFLEKWIVEKGAMPCVSNLEIANCGRLEILPEGLKFLHSLKDLKIPHMSQDFQNRVLKGEDNCKVQHVPSIICDE